MKIEIHTVLETSHVQNYRTVIVAKLLTDNGIEICSGSDRDSWPDRTERPASVKEAVKRALDQFNLMLVSVTNVAKVSGLL